MEWREVLGKNHMLLMFVGCILIFGIAYAGANWFGQPGKWGFWLMILLCPLIHVFMMKDMHKGHEKRHGDGDNEKEGQCH